MTTASFHEALARGPDDDELWSAYADWHEERGDPRAELMRQFSAALVVKHWATWFPNFSPASLDLTWRHGFVSDATVCGDNVRVDVLLGLPSMKWVRSLRFNRTHGFGDLDSLPILSKVTLREARGTSPGELVMLAGVGALDIPSHVLRHTKVRATKLQVRVEDEVTEDELRAFKAMYPHATFSPQLRTHERSSDQFSWTEGPSVSATPRFAPIDVLRLPAWTQTRERDDLVRGVGAGVETLGGHSLLQRCANCASSLVRYVFNESGTEDALTDDGPETWTFERRELRCLTCGQFTSYAATFGVRDGMSEYDDSP